MGPVHYTVEQGDCLSSIAARYGFDWRTLWDHPQNAALKKARKDPNILFPGDVLFIPETTRRVVSLATNARHRIVIKRPMETLRLRLLDELDLPRKALKYEMVVDGARRSGTTNGDGELVEKVPALARELQLFLGEGEQRTEYKVLLGALDPAETISGAQARLTNLGFDPGPCDGILGPRTREAICDFQEQLDLYPTGELDDETTAGLTKQHGR